MLISELLLAKQIELAQAEKVEHLDEMHRNFAKLEIPKKNIRPGQFSEPGLIFVQK
jgi:hypothetical protein